MPDSSPPSLPCGLSFTLRVENSPPSFANPAKSSRIDFSFESRVFESHKLIQLSAESDLYIRCSQASQLGTSVLFKRDATLCLSPFLVASRISCRKRWKSAVVSA